MVPAAGTGLKALRTAAQGCRACPLWKRATQTVFGAGPAHARILLVGEQPGDEEDRQGAPFVGPAGRLLDQALAGVTKQRGVALPFPSGARIVATVHPSAILRAPDSETRRDEMCRFVADLSVARALLAQPLDVHP